MTTAVKSLSRKQLQLLATEAEALAQWNTMRDFATQMYGEGKAVKVEIETYGEYNDEGGTNYYIQSITAYDKGDNELSFDHSLPFFASKAWKKYENEDNDGDDNEDLSTFKELYPDKEECDTWVFIKDLPTDDVTYDFTVIPSLTLPS